MFNYITFYSDNILSLGTNSKVYLEVGGVFYDVTPIQHTSTTLGAAAGPFTATSGSSIITVSYATDVLFVPERGNYVTFSGALSLGENILPSVLNKNFEILTVDSGTTSYTIDVGIQAGSGDTGKGGATVTAAYQIDVGPAGGLTGYGWGVGGWGGASSLSSPDSFTVSGTSPVTLTFSTYVPVNGDVLLLYATVALPTGLRTNQIYYVVQASGSTCKLSLTPGGAAINVVGAGSGTFSASVVGVLTGWGLSPPTPVNLPQRDWWFDNFDSDLIMNIRNGAPYVWERGALTTPNVALNTAAVPLADIASGSDAFVPEEVMQLVVSQNDKHLIAFGSTPYGGGDFDPLLIRWSNQDQPGYWEISPTTSAGFLRCSAGSKIVRAISGRQETVVFTDSALYSLQFIGTPDAVFTLQQIGSNLSIISPRACATVNNTVYWMGKDKFYTYSGRIDTLPCTIRNYIFEDINFSQADQIVSGTNEGWNEIWWFYPSAASLVNDRYAVYNHLEKIWYYGSIDRTSWLDSPLREYPQSTSLAQPYLYDQELGNNDDLLPLEAYIASSDFDIIDGDQFMLIKRIIPDVNFSGSNAEEPAVTMTIEPRNFPGSAYSNTENKQVIETSVDIYTNQVFMRARARQMAFKISSSELGVQWQLGAPRLDGRPDGKR
jgi:hypothetical protein